ncbi:DMT family transporter [Nitrogeniibacter mangrovi]|uniref:DMT family transporter n=1 Tax=Nitrogeniibacter mangrovi TaxID=2016596 RepID=A0A6C1B7K8_9RHOO|nr:DMT family transporter [Nitrogeniibacter mangrovi]
MLVTAVLFFVLLDSTSKHLSRHWSVSLLVWVRYSVHLLLMSALLMPRMGRRLVSTRRPALQIVRAGCLLITSWFIVAALQRMPLAETTAILFSAPLLVTVLARLVLHEHVAPLRWAAVVLGFVGVLLVARPTGDVDLTGLALALCGAGGFAGYQVLTRLLSPTERPLTLLFYTALVGTVCMSVALPWIWAGPLPDARALMQMTSMGVFGGIGHFLLIQAFRLAPASTLSPVLYVQLAWATLLGWLFFDQLPGPIGAVGIIVIGIAGVMTALAARPGANAPLPAQR